MNTTHLLSIYPSVTPIEGFDDCIVGVADYLEDENILVYNRDKIFNKLFVEKKYVSPRSI